MKDFDIWMIRVKGNEISETYADICSKTWTDAGFEINFFDAVTPERVKDFPQVQWKELPNEVEKACLLSQYSLWKQCAETNRPTLVLEHDAYLKKPEYIQYNPYVECTYFGQHCMEAVLFRPSWAKFLCEVVEGPSKVNSGPFAICEHFLGMAGGTRTKKQSKYHRPHLRYLGPEAPVRHAIIPKFGSMILHGEKGEKQTSKRLEYEAELFEIIDLP